MTDLHSRRKEGDEPSMTTIQKPEISNIMPLGPTPGQAKHWAKIYRTEIAACSSSILSTFLAVSKDGERDYYRCANYALSIPWILSRLVCKRTWASFLPSFLSVR